MNRTLDTRLRAFTLTLFALAAAVAVSVALLFWTPLEAPASWRAATQTAGQSRDLVP